LSRRQWTTDKSYLVAENEDRSIVPGLQPGPAPARHRSIRKGINSHTGPLIMVLIGFVLILVGSWIALGVKAMALVLIGVGLFFVIAGMVQYFANEEGK
jgi:hypothetical protein